MQLIVWHHPKRSGLGQGFLGPLPDAPTPVGQWVSGSLIVSDWRYSYRIYQACEFVLFLEFSQFRNCSNLPFLCRSSFHSQWVAPSYSAPGRFTCQQPCVWKLPLCKSFQFPNTEKCKNRILAMLQLGWGFCPVWPLAPRVASNWWCTHVKSIYMAFHIKGCEKPHKYFWGIQNVQIYLQQGLYSRLN